MGRKAIRKASPKRIKRSEAPQATGKLESGRVEGVRGGMTREAINAHVPGHWTAHNYTSIRIFFPILELPKQAI